MLTRSANGEDFAPRLADIQLFRNSFISEAALDSYEYDELWGIRVYLGLNYMLKNKSIYIFGAANRGIEHSS